MNRFNYDKEICLYDTVFLNETGWIILLLAFKFFDVIFWLNCIVM